MIPRYIQRKRNRSGKSTCATCQHQGRLVTHHINGRKVPDWDLPWNRVDICPNCHLELDSGTLQIYGWEMTTVGRTLNFERKA